MGTLVRSVTEPPEMIKDLVGMLVDYNLCHEDVDMRMKEKYKGWEYGGSLKSWKKYAGLRGDVKAARALALRAAGADKVETIKKYVEAQGAKVVFEGEEGCAPDHRVRMIASDRILALMGEHVGGGGVNVNVSQNNVAISVDERTQVAEVAREALRRARTTVEVKDDSIG